MRSVDHISRRMFLGSTLGAGLALPSTLRAADTQTPTPVAAAHPASDLPGLVPPAWCDEPMRWAQLTLVENDPGRFDPQFWLDYFARIHGDRTWQNDGRTVHYLDAWSYTAWFNLLQNPAASVPAGLTSDGLPVGVQVVARHWEELNALAAAREIERALGGYKAPPI